MSALSGLRIGFALTGSFCTFARVFSVIESLISDGAEIIPIMSEMAYGTDTRFGDASTWVTRFELTTGRKVIHTIAQAEPIGPKKLLDLMVVAPCTGNTLAKLAAGVTDTAVTMACKSHLRNGRPLILGVSTNDGLSVAAANIGALLARKNIYFVPYGQDDPEEKPNSLISLMECIPDTVCAAREGRQLQPLIIP